MLKKWIHPFILGCFTLFFLLFRFLTLPKHLAFDEIEFAKIALHLNTSAYIPYTSMANGHSTLYFYVILLSFKLFGINAFALRLPSLLLGIINVFIFFLILRHVTKNQSFSFLTALLFTTQRWYYNFARFSFEATFLLFLELFSLYFLILFVEKKKTHLLIVSAFFTGLAFNSYYPGRIFFIVPLVYLFLQERRKVPFYLLIFIATIAPLVVYLQHNPDTRIEQLFLFSDPKLSFMSKGSQFIQNIVTNIVQLYFRGDMNGRHNYPGKAALSPITGILFTIGLLLSLRHLKDKKNYLFVIFLFVGFIPPLFVYFRENPNMLRSFTLLPSIAYFASVPLFYLLQTRQLPKKIAIAGALCMILISAAYDGRTYFLFQNNVSRFAFEVICRLDVVVRYTPKTLGDVPPFCRT